MSRELLSVVILLVLAGCGGGGGSSSIDPPPSDPAGNGGGPVTPTDPTVSDYARAAKILDLTTFGPTVSEIDAVAREGIDWWLDDQFAQPASLHEPIVRRYGAQYGYELQNPVIFPGLYRRFAFFENALTAPDQLRQLTAYAFTQIFVVSATGMLNNNPIGLASYYDTLLTHSFGNFRDLLRAVTLHPAMGFYLSHVNNAKSDPAANTFPDENYAREVMQLFTIGLYKLNQDGTVVVDTNGRPIPTYDNDDIQAFAKIFTGLTYNVEAGNPVFGRNRGSMNLPMAMIDSFHEAGEKRLLNGQIVPDGQSGMEDIEAAIDNLFQHPNVGPFIGRQLIQRLVTSNPSPDYVARVAAVFAENGSGERGDLEAVLRAILTDSEASDASRVREPFRRHLAVNRSMGTAPVSGSDYGITGFFVQNLTGQMVLTAPSVFNFYSPFYRPPGGQGLQSPEMQITTEDSVVGLINLFAQALYGDAPMHTHSELPAVALDLTPLSAYMDDRDTFLVWVERLFFGGQMREHTRDVLNDTLDEVTDLPTEDQVKVALYVALASPDQAIAEGGTP